MTVAKSAPALLGTLERHRRTWSPPETPVLTATITWGVGEPAGPMGRVPCPHASSPGPLWLPEQSHCRQLHLPHLPQPFPMHWGWVSQCPGAWAVPGPCSPPGLCQPRTSWGWILCGAAQVFELPQTPSVLGGAHSSICRGSLQQQALRALGDGIMAEQKLCELGWRSQGTALGPPVQDETPRSC